MFFIIAANLDFAYSKLQLPLSLSVVFIHATALYAFAGKSTKMGSPIVFLETHFCHQSDLKIFLFSVFYSLNVPVRQNN